MTLIERLTALAVRIGLEVKSKITANHPGVACAWVCFGYDGNAIVLRAAFNVASVNRIARGRYRVYFSQSMLDTHYCWTALARSSTDNGAQRIAIVRETNDEKTEQYVDISCATTSTTYADSTEINLTVFR